MSIKLSPLLASYVESMNAQDGAAFVANFAPDAIVHDEGHEHQGIAAIQGWIEAAWQKYQPKLEVTGVTEAGEETVITGMVSGTFEGSPVELHRHLSIRDGRIAALKIMA